MNYGELQQSVIEDTHRADLSALVPRFIREGEGMIRRDMTAYLLTAQLTDVDRVAAGSAIYNLPLRTLIIRSIALDGRVGDALTRSGLGGLGRIEPTAPVSSYSESGTGVIQFAGNPPEGSILTLTYFGMPESLTEDADTNSLLEDHETLYKSAAMFYLYQNTQDRELSADQLDIFNGVVTTLNEQIARKIGGTKVSQSYNFNGGSSY